MYIISLNSHKSSVRIHFASGEVGCEFPHQCEFPVVVQLIGGRAGI